MDGAKLDINDRKDIIKEISARIEQLEKEYEQAADVIKKGYAKIKQVRVGTTSKLAEIKLPRYKT